PPPNPAVAPVSTILTPGERSRVDAAGEGLYYALHRDSVDDVIRDIKERRASAVLFSAARCGAHEAARVATVVREFPRVPAVALVSQLESQTARSVLALGRSGIRSVVDVRQPNGWRELRDLLIADRGGTIEQLALRRLAGDLAGAPEDCRQFFDALFQASPHMNTIRMLSRQM